MVRSFFKRNGLLLVTVGVYVALALGIAYALDLLVYQQRKRILISDYAYGSLFGKLTLSDFYRDIDLVFGALQAGRDPEPELAQFRATAATLLDGPARIYRLTLVGPKGEVYYDRSVEKQSRANNYRNCLWVMKYSQRGGQKKELLRPDGSIEGTLGYWFYFTTPEQPPELVADIEKLTSRYRWITLAVVATLTGLTLVFVWRVILPVRNVTDRIERSTPARTYFITRPATRLELLYNQMARNTALVRLQEALMERIHGGPGAAGWSLISQGCELLVESGAADLAAAVEVEGEGSEPPKPTGASRICSRPGSPNELTDDGCVESLLNEFARRWPAESGPADHIWLESALGPGAVGAALRDPARERGWTLIAVGLRGDRRPAEPQAATELLGRFLAILQGAIEASMAQSSAMARERDRASVNLSRNLGHDLTNIIATSKLELMTLQRALKGDPPDLSPPRREIISASLEGLLNSTRFLQETVNLYRAYAFVKEPVLEPTDLNELLRETARLFQMSTSGKLAFEMDLAEVAPRCDVDARLIKLALFNLFTNALDAIRRKEGAPEAGVIRLSTRRAGDAVNGNGAEWAEIAVWDNGPGIRDESGRPLAPAEIEKIFGLGYTAGRDGEGEGLGLNWVHTIIRDIHQGSIKAENPEPGGARFVIQLRVSRVRAEAAASSS